MVNKVNTCSQKLADWEHPGSKSLLLLILTNTKQQGFGVRSSRLFHRLTSLQLSFIARRLSFMCIYPLILFAVGFRSARYQGDISKVK